MYTHEKRPHRPIEEIIRRLQRIRNPDIKFILGETHDLPNTDPTCLINEIGQVLNVQVQCISICTYGQGTELRHTVSVQISRFKDYATGATKKLAKKYASWRCMMKLRAEILHYKKLRNIDNCRKYSHN